MSAEMPHLPERPEASPSHPQGLPPEPPSAPLATPVLASGPGQMELIAFQPAAEVQSVDERDDAVVAQYVLVALWHEERLLLVRERSRDCWELPGGGVEPGESSREAAVRELREETGEEVAPERLRLVGYATTALGPSRRVLIGALFTASTSAPTAFTPNEEISEVCWWDGRRDLPRVQTVDTYLANLARPDIG